MSYYTRVEFLFEDEPPDFDGVAECARAHFPAEDYGVEDLIAGFREGWQEGSAEFNRIESSVIERFMCRISVRFPAAKFCVRGRGEDWRDFWLREFSGGEITFAAGPFLDGEKPAFFKFYFDEYPPARESRDTTAEGKIED
jgi:hypothetical protein